MAVSYVHMSLRERYPHYIYILSSMNSKHGTQPTIQIFTYIEIWKWSTYKSK